MWLSHTLYPLPRTYHVTPCVTTMSHYHSRKNVTGIARVHWLKRCPLEMADQFLLFRNCVLSQCRRLIHNDADAQFLWQGVLPEPATQPQMTAEHHKSMLVTTHQHQSALRVQSTASQEGIAPFALPLSPLEEQHVDTSSDGTPHHSRPHSFISVSSASDSGEAQDESGGL